MARLLATVLAGGLVLIAALLVASAQTGTPAGIENYQQWTKMNATALTDPSNPRAGPKNTYINLSPEALRELIGPGGRVPRPFPDGTIVVRESLDAAGVVRVLFVQRKDSAASRTKGWVFNGYTRGGADQPFQPLAIPDPVVRCLDCHAQVRASDYVFTPYTNRPDPLPARAPAAGDRVEIFNNRFGPEILRVKVGTTVVWANYDAVPHDVKAADRSFESGNLPLLGRYFVTFDRPGSVDYFCAVHLEMRGRVMVER